jgi:hypothetical protein
MADGIIGAILCTINNNWCQPPSSAAAPPTAPSEIAILVGKIRQAESDAETLHSTAFSDAAKLVDLLLEDQQPQVALRLVRQLQRIAPSSNFKDLSALYDKEAQVLEQTGETNAADAAARLSKSLAQAERLRQKLVQVLNEAP